MIFRISKKILSLKIYKIWISAENNSYISGTTAPNRDNVFNCNSFFKLIIFVTENTCYH